MVALGAALSLVSACSDWGMQPYNYKTHEKAKIQDKTHPRSVDIDTDEFIMKQRFPLPVFK